MLRQLHLSRLRQACDLLFFCVANTWQSSAGSPQELLCDDGSDDCARGGDTSSSQSLQPSPLPTTTAMTGKGKTVVERKGSEEVEYVPHDALRRQGDSTSGKPADTSVVRKGVRVSSALGLW